VDGKRLAVTPEEVADLMSPAPVAYAPLLRSINEYGHSHLSSSVGQLSRFG
jgi:hypothetical protein